MRSTSPISKGRSLRADLSVPKPNPRGLKRLTAFLIARRNYFFIAILFCTNAFSFVSLIRKHPSRHRQQQQHQGGQQQLLPARTLTQHHAQARANLSHVAISNITQRSFARGYGLQGFVLFSSYRLNRTAFVAIGLSPLILHRNFRAQECSWVRPDGRIVSGNVTVEYPGESHRKMYEVIMLFCHLAADVAADVAAREGGNLFMVIEREEVLVYGETPSESAILEPTPPFASNITYCSSPIYGRFHEQRVVEWIEFHRVGHGVDLFHFYDAGGLDDALLLRLRPLVQRGAATVTDVREIQEFETWYAQVLVINDCAYRSHFSSRWVLFLDFDEYLFVKEPIDSLHTLLKQHEDAAWVSFGSIFFFSDKCSHSMNVSAGMQPRWEVERMIFRQSEIHCVNVKKHASRFFCLAFDGHRKYVADPRKILLAGIHAVSKSPNRGVDLDAREVHLNHFRGLNVAHTRSCKQFIRDTDWIPKSWSRDWSVSRVAYSIRQRMNSQHLYFDEV